MRSLSTSLVALLPVLSLLSSARASSARPSLEDFALALAAGLFIGSYSSIFVAAPLLAWWKEREPQYRALAERRARRPPQPRCRAAAAATAPVGGGADRVADDAGRRRRATTPTRREADRRCAAARPPCRAARSSPAPASSAAGSASSGTPGRRHEAPYGPPVAWVWMDTSSLQAHVRDIPD